MLMLGFQHVAIKLALEAELDCSKGTAPPFVAANIACCDNYDYDRLRAAASQATRAT